MKRYIENEIELLEKRINKNTNIQSPAKKYWDECLTIIRDNIDAQAYSSFFANLIALHYAGSCLTIQVPSQFIQEILDANYSDLLQKTVKRVLGPKGELFYDVVIVNASDVKPATVQYPAMRRSTAVSDEHARQNLIDSNLYADYTFDNFIVGDSNKFAVNAGRAVAKEIDNTRYNPYVIYGESGVGKTHLAHAMGNYIMQQNPRKRCLYVSCEKFTMDFVDQATSNDNRKKESFNNTYRAVDVLIVDDIQFLSGKNQTQEKFFNIFNQLVLAKKQIILTSDKPTRDLKELDNRLASRFIAGLNVEVKIPDFKHRKDIIEFINKTDCINLSDDMINYIATNVTKNVREIEGTLRELVAEKTINGRTISLDLIKEVVLGLATTNITITMDSIIETVCNQYHIKPELLSSDSREYEIVLPRQMAMFLIKKHVQPAPSLKAIGARFGGKNHATVIHSIKVIQNYLETDKKIQNQYELLDTAISLI